MLVLMPFFVAVLQNVGRHTRGHHTNAESLCAPQVFPVEPADNVGSLLSAARKALAERDRPLTAYDLLRSGDRPSSAVSTLGLVPRIAGTGFVLN